MNIKDLNQQYLKSSVKILRNFKDINFNTNHNVENAQVCLKRVESILKTYEYQKLVLKEIDSLKLKSLYYDDVIDELIYENPMNAVIYQLDDINILVNGKEHISFIANKYGKSLKLAYKIAKFWENEFSGKYEFASYKSNKFINSNYYNSGLGVIVKATLHLPILTIKNQLENRSEISKNGFKIQQLKVNNELSLSSLYTIENTNTNFKSFEDLNKELYKVCDFVIMAEIILRNKIQVSEDVLINDKISKTIGVIKYSKFLDEIEYIYLMSIIRLGIEISKINIDIKNFDSIINIIFFESLKVKDEIKSGIQRSKKVKDELSNKL